ncbi:leucine-rich repeat protein [Tanacetum coccineum]
MDKSWMHIVHRLTDPRYELGVKEFLKFAYRFKNNSSLIPCPCKICNNFRNHKKRTVYSHLMQNGISAGYDEWTHHGESCDVSDDSDDDDVSFNDEEAGSDNMNGDNDDDDADDDLDEMLDNIGQGTWGDKWKTSAESSSSIDKDLESLQELYTGCQSYSKFLFIVTMLHLKTTNGWSNKSFNDTLNVSFYDTIDVFKKALPSPSSFPKNFYEEKKYIRDLGFRGDKILASVNDCVLYRGWSVKGYNACPICMNETSSNYLSHSRKVCYMGHRRFLPSSHQWGNDKKNFDGTRETRKPIVLISGLKVLHDIDCTISEPCCSVKKRKRKNLEGKKGWKKEHILPA